MRRVWLLWISPWQKWLSIVQTSRNPTLAVALREFSCSGERFPCTEFMTKHLTVWLYMTYDHLALGTHEHILVLNTGNVSITHMKQDARVTYTFVTESMWQGHWKSSVSTEAIMSHEVCFDDIISCDIHVGSPTSFCIHIDNAGFVDT